MNDDKAAWAKIVQTIIKTELTKRGIKYPALIEKLREINVSISPEDLRGRLSRGTFSAILFVQCLKAIGVKNLTLDDDYFNN